MVGPQRMLMNGGRYGWVGDIPEGGAQIVMLVVVVKATSPPTQWNGPIVALKSQVAVSFITSDMKF